MTRRDVTEPCRLMAILNMTPDSFSDGGTHRQLDALSQFIEQCITHRVDIIDVGGESTRPGADPVTADMELERVIPAIEQIRSVSDISISIDTSKAIVARDAVAAGANIVNDISAGQFDDEMFPTVGKLDVPYILMHIQGTPQTMQEAPEYHDIVLDICQYFETRLKLAASHGIHDITIDPGIGFGKTTAHNFALIRRLREFSHLDRPILVGASRKSFLNISGNRPVTDREIETVAIHAAAIMGGANIIRTHQVEYGRRMIDILTQVTHGES